MEGHSIQGPAHVTAYLASVGLAVKVSVHKLVCVHVKIMLFCTCSYIIVWYANLSSQLCTVGAPVFTATPEDTVVALTDADGNPGLFSLQCQVTGDPTPTIAWFRAGNEIEGETNATLTVSPITGTDATVSGVEYYCEANNSFGRIRSRTANVQLASECDPRKVYCGRHVVGLAMV